MPQSSLLLNNKNVEVIPVGSMIVIDNGKARAYDSLVDSLDDIVGVVPALQNTSGRCWSPFYDGAECYNNDSVVWNEDLTIQLDGDGNAVENPAYAPFNPYTETNKYTIVVCQGFAAVLSSYVSLPTRWKLIQSNSEYNWVLIR